MDVNIFLWGKYDENEAVNLKKDLEGRLAGSKVEIRIADNIHDFHCTNPNIPEDADEVFALAVQEGISLPGLNHDEYLCKDFPSDISEHGQHSVRIFTYVTPVDISPDRYIRKAIVRNIKEKLSELMEQDASQNKSRRFSRMTIIDLQSPNPQLAESDTTILVVRYIASQYKYLSVVPTEIIEAVGENAVKTSSFLETQRVIIESDKILFV